MLDRLWPKEECGCSARENHLKRGPGETQQSGFAGERRKHGARELSTSVGSDRCAVASDEGQHRVCLVTGKAAARLPHNFRAEARTHFICDLEETT